MKSLLNCSVVIEWQQRLDLQRRNELNGNSDSVGVDGESAACLGPENLSETDETQGTHGQRQGPRTQQRRTQVSDLVAAYCNSGCNIKALALNRDTTQVSDLVVYYCISGCSVKALGFNRDATQVSDLVADYCIRGCHYVHTFKYLPRVPCCILLLDGSSCVLLCLQCLSGSSDGTIRCGLSCVLLCLQCLSSSSDGTIKLWSCPVFCCVFSAYRAVPMALLNCGL